MASAMAGIGVEPDLNFPDVAVTSPNKFKLPDFASDSNLLYCFKELARDGSEVGVVRFKEKYPFLIFGRDLGAVHVFVGHPSVACQHAAVVWARGGCFIMDMESSSGTYIGKDLLRTNSWTRLEPNNVVRIGHSSSTYLFTRDPQVPAPPGAPGLAMPPPSTSHGPPLSTPPAPQAPQAPPRPMTPPPRHHGGPPYSHGGRAHTSPRGRMPISPTYRAASPSGRRHSPSRRHFSSPGGRRDLSPGHRRPGSPGFRGRAFSPGRRAPSPGRFRGPPPAHSPRRDMRRSPHRIHSPFAPGGERFEGAPPSRSFDDHRDGAFHRHAEHRDEQRGERRGGYERGPPARERDFDGHGHDFRAPPPPRDDRDRDRDRDRAWHDERGRGAPRDGHADFPPRDGGYSRGR